MYFYYTVTKLFVILLVNLLVNTFKEALILSLTFMLLRGFATGIHAKKNYQCWIITLTIFILTPILIKYINLHSYIYLISYPILIINYLIFSPNDTAKHPMHNIYKRIAYKFLGTTIVILYFFYSINNNSYITEAMFYSSVITLISLHPLTYIVFKQGYYNYRLDIKK